MHRVSLSGLELGLPAHLQLLETFRVPISVHISSGCSIRRIALTLPVHVQSSRGSCRHSLSLSG